MFYYAKIQEYLTLKKTKGKETDEDYYTFLCSLITEKLDVLDINIYGSIFKEYELLKLRKNDKNLFIFLESLDEKIDRSIKEQKNIQQLKKIEPLLNKNMYYIFKDAINKGKFEYVFNEWIYENKDKVYPKEENINISINGPEISLYFKPMAFLHFSPDILHFKINRNKLYIYFYISHFFSYNDEIVEKNIGDSISVESHNIKDMEIIPVLKEKEILFKKNLEAEKFEDMPIEEQIKMIKEKRKFEKEMKFKLLQKGVNEKEIVYFNGFKIKDKYIIKKDNKTYINVNKLEKLINSTITQTNSFDKITKDDTIYVNISNLTENQGLEIEVHEKINEMDIWMDKALAY